MAPERLSGAEYIHHEQSKLAMSMNLAVVEGHTGLTSEEVSLTTNFQITINSTFSIEFFATLFIFISIFHKLFKEEESDDYEDEDEEREAIEDTAGTRPVLLFGGSIEASDALTQFEHALQTGCMLLQDSNLFSIIDFKLNQVIHLPFFISFFISFFLGGLWALSITFMLCRMEYRL